MSVRDVVEVAADIGSAILRIAKIGHRLPMGAKSEPMALVLEDRADSLEGAADLVEDLAAAGGDVALAIKTIRQGAENCRKRAAAFRTETFSDSN